MTAAFDRLTASVAALQTVEEGVVSVIDALSTEVRALAEQLAQSGTAVTEDQLNALADTLDAQKAALADAVAQGTAAEQPPAG